MRKNNILKISVLLLALALSNTACGNKTSDVKDTGITEEQTDVTEEEKTTEKEVEVEETDELPDPNDFGGVISDDKVDVSEPDKEEGIELVEGNLYDDLDSTDIEIVKGSSETSANSEALGAMEELWKKAVEYVNKGDRDGFYSDLFVNGQEGEWDDDYKAVEDIIKEGYPNTSFYEIYELDNYYFMVIQLYSDSQHRYKAFPITKIDEKWLIDRTSESYEKKDEKMYGSTPDGYMDAKNSGRNNYVGDWRCVWMNTSIYVPQQFRTEFVLMWQNDDGSIDILMNVQNGKDKDMQVLEWRMDAQTEGSDGYSTDIFKIDYAGDGTKVPANSSMNMIVHVNKEDVLTGTDKWEFAGFSMQNAYE